MSGPDPGSSDLIVVDGHRDGDLDRVRRFYDEILVPAFPPEELIDPWWEDGGEYDGPFLLALSKDGDVLGGALGEWYPGSRVLLLTYLAVRPGGRGRGTGTALMNAVARRWYPAYDALAVVAELDDPRHHAGRGQDPWLRLRFYEKFGVRAVGAPYFQPRIRASSPRAYHLILAVLAADADALARPDAIRGDVLREFLIEYFTVCEGEAASGDAELAWLLGAYRETVDLISLADLTRVPDLLPPAPEQLDA